MISIVRYLMVGFILISCTSKVNEGVEIPQDVSTKACVGKECAVCSLPWGGTLASGQKLETAFSKNIVTCDQECSDVRATLSCEDGILKSIDAISGLVIEDTATIYPKCYKQRCDCSHNGTVIADGDVKEFYKSSTSSCNTQCESRKLRCRSGKMEDVLEPSQLNWVQIYKNAQCDYVPCSACTTPWGASVAHGKTTKAYSQNEVGCGSSCAQKTITCNNGALSGADLNTFKFGSCIVKACENCELASGDSLVHGTSAYIYSVAESTCTQSCNSFRARASCSNGVITGVDAKVYKYTSCAAKTCKTCKLPCGSTLSSGGSRSCYKKSAPSFCGESCLNESMVFKCDDGIVKNASGEDIAIEDQDLYKSSYCSDLAACSSCKLPDGRSVVDGTKVTFFKSKSVACGQQCLGTNAVTLTCSNGTFANAALYPEYKESTCEQSCNTGTDGDNGIGNWEGEGGGAPRQLCVLPWRGGLVTHKTQIVAFSRMSAPVGTKCSDYKKRIECNGLRGTWSGGATYIYPTCIEEK